MPWELLKKKEHNCRLDGGLPRMDSLGGAEVGSIYECDKEGCGRRFVLRYDFRDHLFWDEIPEPPI